MAGTSPAMTKLSARRLTKPTAHLGAARLNAR
jgi:hypothetical protein